MLLIKYALPMLYLWLGYNAINGKEDFIIFLKKSNIILILYALFIGGFAYKVFPFLSAVNHIFSLLYIGVVRVA